MSVNGSTYVYVHVHVMFLRMHTHMYVVGVVEVQRKRRQDGRRQKNRTRSERRRVSFIFALDFPQCFPLCLFGFSFVLLGFSVGNREGMDEKKRASGRWVSFDYG